MFRQQMPQGTAVYTSANIAACGKMQMKETDLTINVAAVPGLFTAMPKQSLNTNTFPLAGSVNTLLSICVDHSTAEQYKKCKQIRWQN